MKFLFVIVLMLVYSFAGQSFAQSFAHKPVQLTIVNTTVNNEFDLVLSARIISNWQKPIAIPGTFSWGILRYNNGGFLLIEIQKKIGGVFKEVSYGQLIDFIPDESIDSLENGDSTNNNTFSIAGLFKSEQGSYRARVLCKFSTLNPGMKDIYSNWVYFRCEKDVKVRF